MLRAFVIACLGISLAQAKKWVPRPCPPESDWGLTYVYGRLDSVRLVVNRVRHDSKRFKGMRPSRYLWDRKFIAHIDVDSVLGGPVPAAEIVLYPGEFHFQAPADSAGALEAVRTLLADVAVFECDVHDGKMLLKEIHSRAWLDGYLAECADRERLRNLRPGASAP